MFELVRQRSRYNAQFIALDEVFDALDKNGQRAVRNVLEMLSDRVKKVFVVTHSDITSGQHFSFCNDVS
jgi:DNA repair exonuclease SbcCD ATPase subunit